MRCCTEENVFNDLVLSQEDKQLTQRTVREISRKTDIWLRYEITTISLVLVCFGTQYGVQKNATNLNI